jgi:hypothetical protein
MGAEWSRNHGQVVTGYFQIGDVMEAIAGPTTTKEESGKAARVRAAEFVSPPSSGTRPVGQQIEDLQQDLETMRSEAEAIVGERSIALLNDIRAGLWEAFRLTLLAPQVRRKS